MLKQILSPAEMFAVTGKEGGFFEGPLVEVIEIDFDYYYPVYEEITTTFDDACKEIEFDAFVALMETV